MNTLQHKLSSGLGVMIIPDTQAHLNGHTIITYTYSIFKDEGMGNPLLARSKESTLHLEEITDPNYFGFITFENRGPCLLILLMGNRNWNRRRSTNSSSI